MTKEQLKINSSWKPRKSNLKIKAKKLYDNGLSCYAIAKILGLSKTTISYWVNPKHHKRQNEYLKKYTFEKYHTDSEYKAKHNAYTKKYCANKYATCKSFHDKINSNATIYYKHHKDHINTKRKNTILYVKLLQELI
jgi:transposase